MAAAKSILEVDVRDAAFRDFVALFEKYNAQLAKMPGAWGKVNAASGQGAAAVKAQAENANKAAAAAGKAADAQKKFATFSQTAAHAMGTVARSTASVAKNILSATGALIKWAGFTTLFSGLLGAGGLLGASALSNNAGNLRRQSKGAGVSSAELQASSASFGKYVDAEAQLQRINEVRNDVSKRGALAAAGLGRLGALSNADFQAQALKIARNTFIKSGGTRQGAEAHGLLELFSFEELTRLKNTREEEIDTNIKEYQSRKRLLDLNDKQLKSWQDLSIQLDLSGRTITNVLVDKLEPLAVPLTKLSESFAKALGSILGDDRMAGWIDSLGNSIESFAKYLKSDEFTSATKSFVGGIKEMGAAMVKVARFINDPLGSISNGITSAIADLDKDLAAPPVGHAVTGKWQETKPSPALAPDQKGTSTSPRNNPGNLRSWGNLPTQGGFAVFPTTEAGLSAMGKQLQLYGKRGKNTISDIISTYAPSSENNTQAYIDDVVKRTGFKANQRLDLNDTDTLAKLMAAMTKHENNKTNYTPEQIRTVLAGGGKGARPMPQNATVITVNNATGGNAVVSFAAMAH